MTYKEALECCNELRGRFDGFSTSDKKLIERLYKEVLDKRITRKSCKDCYRDAFVEIYNYLKREKRMKEKCNYRLKAGVVLQDFENGRIYTNANLTDKVAKAWLKKYPRQERMFEIVPDEEETEIKDGKEE